MPVTIVGHTQPLPWGSEETAGVLGADRLFVVFGVTAGSDCCDSCVRRPSIMALEHPDEATSAATTNRRTMSLTGTGMVYSFATFAPRARRMPREAATVPGEEYAPLAPG